MSTPQCRQEGASLPPNDLSLNVLMVLADTPEDYHDAVMLAMDDPACSYDPFIAWALRALKRDLATLVEMRAHADDAEMRELKARWVDEAIALRDALNEQVELVFVLLEDRVWEILEQT